MFFPKSSTPPVVGAPLSDSHKPTLSKPHCVKGFADNLTIISQCECEHASALLSGSEKYSDIDLQIRPDKCVSFVYSGYKFKKSCSFPIGGGHSRNLAHGSARFLGHKIAHSLSVQKKLSNKNIKPISRHAGKSQRSPTERRI